ncbi:Protein CBG02008 [Caenorhabditis briggsae]|uniref:Protein CBG02008 n=1 Tax=Caenorhabditis briggsae TaxID=6238 RepID=A8WRS8_CAEBR|nr:Protein CBG02008 [Caenorhabditis briggsae]CAP23186.2 Protein CBG02008 [Caenorhabditis briggsae]
MMASTSTQPPKRIRPVAVVIGTPRQVEPPHPMIPPPLQPNFFVVQDMRPQLGEREEIMRAGGRFEPIGPPMFPEPEVQMAPPMVEPQPPIIQGLMIIPPPAIVIQFGPAPPAFPAPHLNIPHPMHQAPQLGQFQGPLFRHHHPGSHQGFQGQAPMFQPGFAEVFQPPLPFNGPNQMDPENGVAMNMVLRPRRVGRPMRNMQQV